MNRKIVLASGSPRRQELLGLICPAFTVCPSGADETLNPAAPLDTEILRLARDKAREVLARTAGHCCVIGADTMVVCGAEPFGKPQDAQDARRMLRALSGQTHEVLTAVAVLTEDGGETCALSRTAVTFYELSEDDISAYLATGEPMDKAGAYGIQGRGAVLVRRIEGDFYSVMGLPVALLAHMLRENGLLTSLL